MDNTQEQTTINNNKYKLINIILYIIEVLSSLSFIPLQLIRYIHDIATYPDGYGGFIHKDYYYNLWDNIDNSYMIIFNILLFTSILFNIICIININKINKSFLIISHIIFISIIMVLIPILFIGMQSRSY